MSRKNGSRKKQRIHAEKQPLRRKGVTKLLGRFGPYLSQRREQENLTLREFAVRARMPFANVFQMESKRKNPRLTELEKLARGFGEPLLDFLKPVVELPQQQQ